MPDYEEYRALFADCPREETLPLLKSEAIRLLSTLTGYAELVSKLVEERGVPQMPDDFNQWCDTILTQAHALHDLIDAATSGGHHLSIRQEQTARWLELGKALWADAQQGLPELRPYSSLKDAIEQIAKENNLALREYLSSDELEVRGDLGSSVDFYGHERRAHVGPQKSRANYIGYSLTIGWLVDVRNIKGDKYECLAPSLGEAVIVLHYWLVEGWSLLKLIEQHPWMAQNTT